VAYYDPHVPVIRPTREHPQWAGRKSVTWDKKTISAFDVVVIATAHERVNYKELAEWSPLIVDSRNAMGAARAGEGKVWKA
jgi:UDP-N-acetyl-D-glucosamine dehydrogenase